MDIFDAQQFLEKEKEAENYAILFAYGVNFTDCLRMHQIETELEVDGKKIAAHRIYSAWDAYLIAQGSVMSTSFVTKTRGGKEKEKPRALHPYNFTGIVEKHQNDMFLWITTQYTEMYRSLKSEDEQTWLKTIIRFVIYRRIMESKYQRWITTGKGFADSSVAMRIAEVYRFKYEMPQIARLIHEKLLHHKEREAEEWEKRLAEDIIAGVFDLLRADRLRLLPPSPPDIRQIDEGKDAV